MKEIFLEHRKYWYDFKDYVEAKKFAVENGKRVCLLIKRTAKDGSTSFCERGEMTPIEDLDIKSVGWHQDDTLYIPQEMTLEEIKEKVLDKIVKSDGKASEVEKAFNRLEVLERHRKPQVGYLFNCSDFSLIPLESTRGGHLSCGVINDVVTDFYIAVTGSFTETEAFVGNVLNGKVIPCVGGRMPEDFIKYDDIRTRNVFGYTDNAKPYKTRIGAFVIYDKEGKVGYAYRVLDEKVIWRWYGVCHPNIMAKDADYKIVGWQMSNYDFRMGGDYFINANHPFILIR